MINPVLEIQPHFGKVLIGQVAPVKTFYSGRAGGKSHSYARALLWLGSQSPMYIVCGRQFFSSIRKSVKRLFDNLIKKHRLEAFYKSTNDYIEGSNGTKIEFMGLDRNPEEIKGLEDVKIFWIEEGQTLKQESIDILLPTIIRNKGSQVWVSINPGLASSPGYQTFIANPAPNWIVAKTSFLENRYVDDGTLDLAAWWKRHRPHEFDNVWMGNPLILSEFNVFSKFKTDRITKEDLDLCSGPYYGMDFGHTIDPCTLVEVYLNHTHRKLYITRELYEFRLELDDMPKWIGDGMSGVFGEETIIADSSRPETISFLCRRGGSVVPANKYPGSILEGIDFIKNFEVIIAPECTHTHFEFCNYSWQRDQHTGKPKPKEPEDKNNHIIDSIRYSLNNHLLSGDDFVCDAGKTLSSQADW